MIHQFEILKIVSVSLTDTLCTISHLSEEHFGFEVGHHEHLKVISLNVINCLICTEEALLLDLDYELLQAFNSSCIVGLSAIFVLIVAYYDPL